MFIAGFALVQLRVMSEAGSELTRQQVERWVSSALVP